MSTETTGSSSAVQRSKEALLADLKRVVGDANALLNDMSNSTADDFSSVRSRFEAKLGEVRSRIDDARALVTRKAYDAADATHEYIHENPVKIIGIASLVGILTALLLFRRSQR